MMQNPIEVYIINNEAYVRNSNFDYLVKSDYSIEKTVELMNQFHEITGLFVPTLGVKGENLLETSIKR